MSTGDRFLERMARSAAPEFAVVDSGDSDSTTVGIRGIIGAPQ
jgi:hypothetical protein